MLESGLITVLALLMIISLIVFRLNKYKVKGILGESRVSRQLRRIQSEEYQIINNLLIKNGNFSSQIDHVIVSVYGIFVIETKNYSGWIHGSEHSEYWKQSLYRTTTKFRNPLKQNWAHIFALKAALPEYKKVIYHSIIVFTGSAELKNVYSSTPVIYDSELFGTIRNRSNRTILSIGEVKEITSKLAKINAKDKSTQKEHIYHTNYQAYQRRLKMQALICPRCGANLITRKGQYGSFYGCTNYPKCRYTQKSYD